MVLYQQQEQELDQCDQELNILDYNFKKCDQELEYLDNKFKENHRELKRCGKELDACKSEKHCYWYVYHIHFVGNTRVISSSKPIAEGVCYMRHESKKPHSYK